MYSATHFLKYKRHTFLKMSKPKIITTRKPINPIRMFKIGARAPKVRSVSKLVITSNVTSSNQTNPVKNPRKSPKMPQEE
jgi:hypothetical protein